jgi:hypothetical protein
MTKQLSGSLLKSTTGRVQGKGVKANERRREMKPEFTIKQIRSFVSKGYTSVSARYVKSALHHYDEQLNKKHCTCSDEKSTGWTTVKCCNICGNPVEDESWFLNNE